MSQLSFDDLPAEPEPEARAKPAGDLYVIGEANGCGVVKIGRAVKPRKRLGDLQVGNPRLLRILHVEEGAGDLEQLVHGRVHGKRLQGEWFDFGDRDPVAEVQRAVEMIRSGAPSVTGARPAGRLKRSRWNIALILARSRALDDFLDPVQAFAHLFVHEMPERNLAEWPIPWEWRGLDFGITRRALEEWATAA